MAWTAPTTRTTGELITAAIWNTDVVDNLDALKAPPSSDSILDLGGDLTTTSTSFADVDATNLSETIVTTGGDVMVHFHGTVKGSAGFRLYFEIDMDGSAVAGDDGIALEGVHTDATFLPGLKTVTFTRLITSVSPGSHTFKLQWKVSSGTAILYAGAGTANYDVHPQFWAREAT